MCSAARRWLPTCAARPRLGRTAGAGTGRRHEVVQVVVQVVVAEVPTDVAIIDIVIDGTSAIGRVVVIAVVVLEIIEILVVDIAPTDGFVKVVLIEVVTDHVGLNRRTITAVAGPTTTADRATGRVVLDLRTAELIEVIKLVERFADRCAARSGAGTAASRVAVHQVVIVEVVATVDIIIEVVVFEAEIGEVEVTRVVVTEVEVVGPVIVESGAVHRSTSRRTASRAARVNRLVGVKGVANRLARQRASHPTG